MRDLRANNTDGETAAELRGRADAALSLAERYEADGRHDLAELWIARATWFEQLSDERR